MKSPEMFSGWENKSSHLGIEPRIFGLEVQRAILCANGTRDDKNLTTVGNCGETL